MPRLSIFLSVLIACSTAASSPPVCTNGFTLVNNKCLKLFPTLVTHKVAEKTCMGYGATLVTVRNSNDNTALSTFVGSSASLIWIGIYCFESDPSKCEWDDFLGPADVYDNFASGFPLVEIGNCVYYSAKGALAGQWLSGHCEQEARAFVCELPYTHADTCTHNYGGHCYTFHNYNTQFADAQMACEQECGNLPSISSPNENRWLTTQLGRNTYYFIGGMWPSPNVYSWIDGSVWNYNNIGPDSEWEGSTCMILYASDFANKFAPGTWASARCTLPLWFICKRPAGITYKATPPPVTVTPVPLNPSNCNSSVLAPGIITSPNFPSNYDYDVYCVYHLSTIGSYNVILQFKSFETQPCCAKFHVYDGGSTDSPLLGSFSGTNNTNVISTGNLMTVVFESHSGTIAQGFRARVLPYYSGL